MVRKTWVGHWKTFRKGGIDLTHIPPSTSKVYTLYIFKHDQTQRIKLSSRGGKWRFWHSVYSQLAQVLSYAGSIGANLQEYQGTLFVLYQSLDLGAVLLHVMKKYNFQIQGYEPIERCVWVAYYDVSAQTPDMHTICPHCGVIEPLPKQQSHHLCVWSS